MSTPDTRGLNVPDLFALLPGPLLNLPTSSRRSCAGVLRSRRTPWNSAVKPYAAWAQRLDSGPRPGSWRSCFPRAVILALQPGQALITT
jgi:hypothetical protein